MLCYGFPNKGSACSAKDSPAKVPLAPCGLGVFTKYDTKSDDNPHSTERWLFSEITKLFSYKKKRGIGSRARGPSPRRSVHKSMKFIK
jgi:hypothetical protein